MKAAAYIRVSTDEQARQGYSLAGQEEACIRYLKEHNHELVKCYIDDGYTAKHTKRPALQEMLEDIRQKKIKFVVVWNSDRLTRTTIDGLTMVTLLFNPHGVGFASVTEDIDTSTPDGMMMFTIRLSLAQREREKIAERVSLGQTRKAKTGKRVHLGAIFGYDVIDGKLIINEIEAEVVRLIFDLYVYKGWGYGKISTYLNDEGMKAKKTVWYASTVKGILLNVTYAGYNAHTPVGGSTTIEKGEHDPIISLELSSMAISQRTRRGNQDMSRSSFNYPFSSIVKCGECGSSYTAYYTKKPKDKEKYCNYRCQNKKSGLCHASDIAGMKLEKLFFDYFDREEREVETYVPELSKDELKEIDKEKKRIEREMNKLNSRKSNLLDQLGDNIITSADYTSKVDEISNSLKSLKEKLDSFVDVSPKEVVSKESVVEMVEQLREDWKYMEDKQKKFVIQIMFRRILIKKIEDVWTIKELIAM